MIYPFLIVYLTARSLQWMCLLPFFLIINFGQTDTIHCIVKTIIDIALQTNLLALNVATQEVDSNVGKILKQIQNISTGTNTSVA